jgi:hypothetical protein
MGKSAGRKAEEVDEDYKQAAALAGLVAPHRHLRLSAVKIIPACRVGCCAVSISAGVPNRGKDASPLRGGEPIDDCLCSGDRACC